MGQGSYTSLHHGEGNKSESKFVKLHLIIIIMLLLMLFIIVALIIIMLTRVPIESYQSPCIGLLVI